MIVSTYLNGDDEHHRPEDEAQHAIDVQPVGLDRMMSGKGFAERVKRAGADVAEHDSDRADGKLKLAIAVMSVPVMGRFGGGNRSACGAPPAACCDSAVIAPLDEPEPL